jgi:tetratricopeptide (TPR) repeat protein
MIEHDQQESISLKKFLIPLTTVKAIHFIVFIGLIVYANVLFNGFVWDDIVFILNNYQVHSLNIIQLFSKSEFNSGGYYRPIPALYFATIYALVQNQPFYYHLIQICLHITITCLIYLLYTKFFNKGLSLILSLVFLVHPINFESVGFIGATQSELFTLFGLIALLLSEKVKALRSVLVIGFFLLIALLAKEVAIAFLFLALLWQILYKKEKAKLFIVLDAGVILSYSIIRFGLANVFLEKTTDNLIDRLSLWERVLNIPAIVWYYLKTLFFPKDLAILQQWTVTKLTPANFYIPLLLDTICFIIFIVFSLYIFKRRKGFIKTYIFFAFWFFSGIVFLLQIFPLDQTVADRWFYFPLIGFLGLIGIFFESFRIKIKVTWTLSIVSIILILLSTRTIIRSFDWRNELTLDLHDVKISTNSWALENDLGTQYSQEGQYNIARIYEERSVQIDPNQVNYVNLGILYADIGEYRQAKEEYLASIRYGDYFKSYESLAFLDTVYGNPKENIKYIQDIALKKFSYDATLWLCLAILEYNQGNKDIAKSDITQAYKYSQSPQTIAVYNAVFNGKLKKIKVVIIQ